MRRDDYIVIKAWMRDLGLTDKQLLLYALVWGYSRDGRSRVRATAKYLGDWLGCSERHAQRLVCELENRGLVEHEVLATKAGLVSEFWAVLPEEAEAPERGTKKGISWTGRKVGRVTTSASYSPGEGYDIGVRGVTTSASSPIKDIPGINIIQEKKYKKTAAADGRAQGRARTRAAQQHQQQDFSLFSEENIPESPAAAPLKLPFTEDAFRDIWELLLTEKTWARKSRAALQLTLDELAQACDLSGAIWCVKAAILNGWDTIKDPAGMVERDFDRIPQYPTDAETLAALERRGELPPELSERRDALRRKLGRAAA